MYKKFIVLVLMSGVFALSEGRDSKTIAAELEEIILKEERAYHECVSECRAEKMEEKGYHLGRPVKVVPAGALSVEEGVACEDICISSEQMKKYAARRYQLAYELSCSWCQKKRWFSR